MCIGTIGNCHTPALVIPKDPSSSTSCAAPTKSPLSQCGRNHLQQAQWLSRMMPSLIPSFLFVMPTSPLKGPDKRHSPRIWSLRVQVCTRLSVSCSCTRVGVSGMCASPRVHTRWLELCFLPIGEIYIEPQINFIIFSSLIMPTSVARQAVCVCILMSLPCSPARSIAVCLRLNFSIIIAKRRSRLPFLLLLKRGKGGGKESGVGEGEAAGKRRQGRAKGSYSTWVCCRDLFIPSGKQRGCGEHIDREGRHPGATRVMVHDLSGNLLAVRPEI